MRHGETSAATPVDADAAAATVAGRVGARSNGGVSDRPARADYPDAGVGNPSRGGGTTAVNDTGDGSTVAGSVLGIRRSRRLVRFAPKWAPVTGTHGGAARVGEAGLHSARRETNAVPGYVDLQESRGGAPARNRIRAQ